MAYDPTIFETNGDGDFVHSDEEPYFLPRDTISFLSYGEMRDLSSRIGKIFVHALKRSELRAEVRARLAKGK